MKIILKYFPELTGNQILQLSKLKELYTFWNNQINVISRKDIDYLYLHHVLHSLSIAKIISFKNSTTVLDVGTGGGFPGIPLAIVFPDTQFMLIDSIGKKIKVVNSIIETLELKNAKAKQQNVTEINQKFDFIVCRAVTALPEFYSLVKKNISAKNTNNLTNGIIYIKGGNVDNELSTLKTQYKVKSINIFEIKNYFSEEYFETKKIIHVPAI